MKLTDDLFIVFGEGISGRDLILILGGLFLIAKSTQEVHNSLEGMVEDEHSAGRHRDVRQRAACRSASSTSCFRSIRSSPRWASWRTSR